MVLLPRLSHWGRALRLAGLMLDARIGVAVPDAGTGLELTVIAAAVIGGTSLFGGVGTAIGAVIGALLLESLNNGMGLMNIQSSFSRSSTASFCWSPSISTCATGAARFEPPGGQARDEGEPERMAALTGKSGGSIRKAIRFDACWPAIAVCFSKSRRR